MQESGDQHWLDTGSSPWWLHQNADRAATEKALGKRMGAYADDAGRISTPFKPKCPAAARRRWSLE